MARTLLACAATALITALLMHYLQNTSLQDANGPPQAASTFAAPAAAAHAGRRLTSTSSDSAGSAGVHGASLSQHIHSLLSSGSSGGGGGGGRELLYQGGGFSPRWRRTYGTYKSRWHPTVLNSVFRAQQKLTTTPQQRAERMFVPMLSSRHEELCCMLTDLSAKAGGHNALDVFVFSVDNAAEGVFNRSPCWRRRLNLTAVFMPLDEHWTQDPRHTSSAMHDRNAWVGMPGLFGDSYRRMGHWRLTFQFAFADMLGYRYVWQLDDDSFFPRPLNFSMLDHMRERGLWVAGARTLVDPHMVTWGLPEMARLFLVGERMEPPGTLFTNHTQPPGLEGLYTVRGSPAGAAAASPGGSGASLVGDEGGWSRAIIHGNCLAVDMEAFWWPKEVQRFVELVLHSGYHYRFRWNEQGVIAMVWQLFVPAGRFQLDDLPFEYVHPHKVWGTCA